MLTTKNSYFRKKLKLKFMSATQNPEIMSDCIAASRHVLAREYYKALMAARKLVEYEEQRLGNVPSGVQDSLDEG